MKSIEELVHSNIRDMHPYIPGMQPSGSGWIKLNTNELPYGPPPEVGAAIASEVESLARYPNPRSDGLREALAEFHGLETDQVIVAQHVRPEFSGCHHRAAPALYSLLGFCRRYRGSSVG